MNQELLVETLEEGIMVITLNRPDKRNAVNAAMRQALFDAFARFDADPALRVAILTGSGSQSFCAGADLKEMSEEKMGIPPRSFFPVLGDNVMLTKPVIAAVNGDAFAGGWLFAQMCDLCVASRGARFGITEAKVGRGFAWAAPLIHMIPQKIMAELLMTGMTISAQRAHELGFVNRLAEPAELMACALGLAREIVAAAPLSVAAAKQLIALSVNAGRSVALEVAPRLFDSVYSSHDAQEGPAAFRSKRKPVWTGR